MADLLAASPWILTAGIGSCCVGFGHVVLHVRVAAGGGVRGIGRALGDRLPQFMSIVAVDFLGGLLVAGTALASGITEPPKLISLIGSSPWLGWAIMGGLGPLLSARLFGGSTVRNRFHGWFGTTRPAGVNDTSRAELETAARSVGLQAQAWRLRSEALFEIEMRALVLVQRRLSAEAERLLKSGQDLVGNSPAKARQLVRVTRQMIALRQDVFPTSVVEAVGRISGECAGEALKDLLDTLVNELVDTQSWYPLEALLGDADESLPLEGDDSPGDGSTDGA